LKTIGAHSPLHLGHGRCGARSCVHWSLHVRRPDCMRSFALGCRNGWIVGPIDIAFRTGARDCSGRNSADRRVLSDVADYDCVGSDRCEVADMYAADYYGSRSDIYVVTDDGTARPFTAV